MDVVKQKEILHHAIENRVLLKTIIKKNLKTIKDSESDSDSDTQKDASSTCNTYRKIICI